jgi:uncharacterized protein YdeI (YjbR/CyaY-like superfamily)
MNTDTFHPTTRQEWRQWLEQNHASSTSIWVIYLKKQPTFTWSDAVDEALCFGWIDSTRRTLDNDKFLQFFTRRKPKSTWSRINKEKVKFLIETGKMQPAGLQAISLAKENGSWSLLDDVEALKIPKDLAAAFSAHPGSKACFNKLSRSAKKLHLVRLTLAKKQETRQKRINEILSNMHI